MAEELPLPEHGDLSLIIHGLKLARRGKYLEVEPLRVVLAM